MAAPEGNQFWKLANVGADKAFSTPDELWEKAMEYFEWCDQNPWVKRDFVRGGESAGTIVELQTSRPYTIQGLCLRLGISDETFANYSGAKGYEAFFGICKRIRQIIYTQKFEGAAVGAFNANIIARDLGLVDKKETQQRRVKVSMNLGGNLKDSESGEQH